MANKKEALNVQPHSIDAEQAVLGSMLTNRDAVNKAFEKKLSSEHFYKKSHSLIFAAMEILDKKNVEESHYLQQHPFVITTFNLL